MSENILNEISKLKASPEGRPNCWLVSNDNAQAWIAEWFDKAEEYDVDSMHNVRPSGNMMLGCDWQRDSFDQFKLDGWDEENNNYGWVAVTDPNDPGIFAGHQLVRVDAGEMYVFDVGVLTDDHIEPIESDMPNPFKQFHDE